MDAAGLFVVFVLVLVLVTVAAHVFRVPPFFALVGGALLFGLLSGLGLDATIREIVDGVGRVFGAFGILILSGAVIAKALESGGGIDEIAADMRRRIRAPVATAGLLGYLLAVPLTCCITAYVLLVPVVSALGGRAGGRSGLLYVVALGSVASYVLVYPTPVTLPLAAAFLDRGTVLLYAAVAVPLSLLTVLLLVLSARHRAGVTRKPPRGTESGGHPIHARAWLPFGVIVASAGAGFLAGVSHLSLVNLAMLAGAASSLALAPSAERHTAGLAGAKHAGVIIFDLVGAGAIGSVVVASGIVNEALASMTGLLPVLLVPFLLAALVQTVQGSRVVTAVIAAELLSGTPVAAAVDPVSLVLMVGAGTCVVSYVTDPFFWLVQRTTGDTPLQVVRWYTVPLAAVGVLTLLAAILVQVLL